MDGKTVRVLLYVLPPLAVGGFVFGFYFMRPAASAGELSAASAPEAAAPAPGSPAPAGSEHAHTGADRRPSSPPAASDRSKLPPGSASTPAVAAPVVTGEPPVIVFEDKEFDFGTLFAGEKVEHLYRFRNDGKGTLNITNVRASCGCTAVNASKSALEPGESGEIRVNFDSTGRPGQNEKHITVSSNDPREPQVTLKIKGLVREEVWTEPLQVQLGQLRRGQKIPDQKIRVLTLKSHPVDVLEVTASKPQIEIARQPIETEAEKGVELTLSFPDWSSWINPSKPTYLAEYVNVKTSSTKLPVRRIMLYAQILEDILCEPKYLSFAAIPQGEESEKTLLISGAPEVRFTVTGVEKTSDLIETSIQTLEEGRKYQLSVKVLNTAPIGRFRDTLKILTDHAAQDAVSVYVYGAVKDPSEPEPMARVQNSPSFLRVNGFHEAIAGRTRDSEIVAKYGEPTRRDPATETGGATLVFVGNTHANLLAFESAEFEVDADGVLKEVRLHYKK